MAVNRNRPDASLPAWLLRPAWLGAGDLAVRRSEPIAVLPPGVALGAAPDDAELMSWRLARWADADAVRAGERPLACEALSIAAVLDHLPRSAAPWVEVVTRRQLDHVKLLLRLEENAAVAVASEALATDLERRFPRAKALQRRREDLQTAVVRASGGLPTRTTAGLSVARLRVAEMGQAIAEAPSGWVDAVHARGSSGLEGWAPADRAFTDAVRRLAVVRVRLMPDVVLQSLGGSELAPGRRLPARR